MGLMASLAKKQQHAGSGLKIKHILRYYSCDRYVLIENSWICVQWVKRTSASQTNSGVPLISAQAITGKRRLS